MSEAIFMKCSLLHIVNLPINGLTSVLEQKLICSLKVIIAKKSLD